MSAPHPFTLRQLQYVVAIAEERSFHRAAERCHVSQPSISSQVTQLEELLGVALFERDRRGVIPTAAGELLVERARSVLTAADDLVSAARGLADPLAGQLRLGVIPTIAPYLLPKLVPALARHAPRLTVLWREARTDELLTSIRAGRLDGALLAAVGGMEDLDRIVVADDRFLLAAAKGHPLASRGRAQSKELDGARVLLLEDGHCLRDQALEVCSRAHLVEGEFRATSLATLVSMVSSGLGVTLLPELALPVENRRGELVVRRFAGDEPKRTLVVAWRRSSPLGPAFERVARAAKEAARRAD